MFTIFHNPRCSKSRETLELLEKNGISPSIIKYLETPPSKQELKALLKQMKLNVRDIIRTKEAEYAELGLASPDLSDEYLLECLVSHPKLIERPIVSNGERAVIGRPPENILELLK